MGGLITRAATQHCRSGDLNRGLSIVSNASFNDFVGSGKRLTDADIANVAAFLGADTAAVRAVIDVEAASYGFDARGRPRILNEPHIFWRELGPGAARDQAGREGLAYARWGARPYLNSMDARYGWLARASKIDRDAALRSCSWGLGQVMGFNHEAAGFDTVTGFVADMMDGEGQQLMAMARFIKTRGLDRHMRTRDWTAFARGYNGAGFATHGYHTRLAQAYRRHAAKAEAEPHEPGKTVTLLRRGDNGDAVIELRERLSLYGYDVDGPGPSFGPKTDAAVRRFQEEHELLVDGVVGKATWAALRSDPDEADPDPDPEEAIPAPPESEHEAPAEAKGGLLAAIAILIARLWGR